MKKNLVTIFALLALVVVGSIIAIAFDYTKTESVFCTADVFECPNGDYVGRTPPGCAFAECNSGFKAEGYYINVDYPLADQIVDRSFQVRGTSRTYHNLIQYALTDLNNSVLTSGYLYNGAEKEAVAGPFSFTVDSGRASGEKARLELFVRDVEGAKNLSIFIPVLFK